ncbi:HNH endonuclease [Candidatus Saccharibacteria bacterium]|nr:HNH endonuclease [Candidatus Saccharibacteria bacterium]
METRDVVGYEDYYAVTDDGRVWSKRHGKYIRLYKTKKGYLRANLWDKEKVKGKFVHRLVCEAFHGLMPEEGMVVDHINAIRDDNRVENLRWVTVEQNNAHSAEMGNIKPQRAVVVFNEDGDVMLFPSKAAARKAGWPVDDILNHQAYTIRGYTAAYEDEFDGCIGVWFEQMNEVRRRRFMNGRRKITVSEPIVGVSLKDGSEVKFPSISAARLAGFRNLGKGVFRKEIPYAYGRIWYKESDGVEFQCGWTEVV